MSMWSFGALELSIQAILSVLAVCFCRRRGAGDLRIRSFEIPSAFSVSLLDPHPKH